MPAALYKLCRAPDSEPILITNEIVMQSSRQLQAPLLCSACEDILNCGGETWLLPLLATIDGAFPLYDILKKVPPDVTEPDCTMYAASKNAEIQTSKLVHFALAIFWKASAHSWRGGTRTPLISFGKYGDEIRKFVLGEGPFPRNCALIVAVESPPVKQISFNQPYLGSRSEFHSFFLYVPGISFGLAVGKQIKEPKSVCCYSHPAHPIILTAFSLGITEVMQRIASKARKSSKVQEYWLKRSGSAG